MTDKQPEALHYADILENTTNFYPESSSMPDLRLAEVAGESAALLRTQHAEIERLNSCLKWEQNRAERIGTHGPGCEKWGPSHFECALRAIERKDALLRQALDTLGCTHEDDDPGHRCGHCDDYVDRNGTLRSAITKELSQ